jgi:hypothetical protein
VRGHRLQKIYCPYCKSDDLGRNRKWTEEKEENCIWYEGKWGDCETTTHTDGGREETIECFGCGRYVEEGDLLNDLADYDPKYQSISV